MPLTDLVRYFDDRHRHDGTGLPTGFALTGDGRIHAHLADLALDSVFQPIVDRHGKTVGHEALLRPRSPDGRPLPPETPFLLATDAAEVVAVDRLCRTLHALNALRQNRFVGNLHLNVHPRHLLAIPTDHGATFETVLRKLGLSPKRVVLEVHADSIEDAGRLEQAISGWRQRGYRISLDNFGRDASDPIRLRKLRPDAIKLDRKLTAGAIRDAGLRKLQRTLIELALDLNAQTIAVGIENDLQLDEALAAGAQLVQGFHLGPPHPDCVSSTPVDLLPQPSRQPAHPH